MSAAPPQPDPSTYLDLCLRRLGEALDAHGVAGTTVEGRVKTAAAAARKRAVRPDGHVNDFIGLRVVVDHGGQIPAAVAAVQAWADRMDLRGCRFDDHFERPGTGGYHALHIDYELADPEAVGVPPGVGLEVQVTTAIFAALARVSHAVLYRRSAPGLERISAQLEEIAADALELDRKIARLAGDGATPK